MRKTAIEDITFAYVSRLRICFKGFLLVVAYPRRLLWAGRGDSYEGGTKAGNDYQI
jgi:hypothetical protein